VAVGWQGPAGPELVNDTCRAAVDSILIEAASNLSPALPREPTRPFQAS
jgi:hypothetical protein